MFPVVAPNFCAPAEVLYERYGLTTDGASPRGGSAVGSARCLSAASQRSLGNRPRAPASAPSLSSGRPWAGSLSAGSLCSSPRGTSVMDLLSDRPGSATATLLDWARASAAKGGAVSSSAVPRTVVPAARPMVQDTRAGKSLSVGELRAIVLAPEPKQGKRTQAYAAVPRATKILPAGGKQPLKVSQVTQDRMIRISAATGRIKQRTTKTVRARPTIVPPLPTSLMLPKQRASTAPSLGGTASESLFGTFGSFKSWSSGDHSERTQQAGADGGVSDIESDFDDEKEKANSARSEDPFKRIQPTKVRPKKKEDNPFMEFEDREQRLVCERRWLKEDESYLQQRVRGMRLDSVQARLEKATLSGSELYKDSVEFSNYACQLRVLQPPKKVEGRLSSCIASLKPPDQAQERSRPSMTNSQEAEEQPAQRPSSSKGKKVPEQTSKDAMKLRSITDFLKESMSPMSSGACSEVPA